MGLPDASRVRVLGTLFLRTMFGKKFNCVEYKDVVIFTAFIGLPVF